MTRPQIKPGMIVVDRIANYVYYGIITDIDSETYGVYWYYTSSPDINGYHRTNRRVAKNYWNIYDQGKLIHKSFARE